MNNQKPIKIMDKSVKILTDHDLCYECGTCSSICPTGAISMKNLVERGLIYPEVNPETCVNCSKCLQVCPINNIDANEQHLPTSEDYIGIYNSTDKERFGYTASGGIVTEMLATLFKNKEITKAIVTGMKENSTDGLGFIIESTEELQRVSGSVYQPVAINELLSEIKPDDKVAFVGLPCHMRGLNLFLKQRRRLQQAFVIKIGIICSIGRGKHGTTRMLQKEFGIKDESQIEKMIYRYGTPPGETQVHMKSGEIKKINGLNFLQNTDYIFMPKGCLFCPDLFNDQADVTVGDPWGMNKGKKAMAIVRNPQVKELLNQMVENNQLIFDEEITAEQCAKTQGHSVNYKIHNYHQRVNTYQDMGVEIPSITGLKSEEIKDFKTIVAYKLLMRHALFFNSKIGLKVANTIPNKILYRYRGIILSLNTRDNRGK